MSNRRSFFCWPFAAPARQGLTLAELVITLALFGLMVTPIALIMASQSTNWRTLLLRSNQRQFTHFLYTMLSGARQEANFDAAWSTPVYTVTGPYQNMLWSGTVDTTASTAFHRKGTVVLCRDSSCVYSNALIEAGYDFFIPEIRIDCGNNVDDWTGTSGFLDASGQLWNTDLIGQTGLPYKQPGFSGTTTKGSNTSVAITNSSNDLLYQTWRTGTNIGYDFDVDNGLYLVQLHFAETDSTINGTLNRRLADIVIEGSTLLSAYSPFEWTTANGRADIRSFIVRVSDNVLNISINRSASSNQDPRLAALSVRRLQQF